MKAVPLDLGRDGRLAGGERRLAGDDPRAVALGRRPLDRRRGPGHHDGDRDAEQLAGQGQGLGVVARGVRDHAGAPGGFVELEHGVDGPAELEGADLLEVLALEEDRAAAPRVERPRGHHGRAVGPGRDPLGGARGCRRSRSGSATVS